MSMKLNSSIYEGEEFLYVLLKDREELLKKGFTDLVEYVDEFFHWRGPLPVRAMKRGIINSKEKRSDLFVLTNKDKRSKFVFNRHVRKEVSIKEMEEKYPQYLI